MSITTGDFRAKITASTLLEKKQRHEIITCLTAYDYPARAWSTRPASTWCWSATRWAW